MKWHKHHHIVKEDHYPYTGKGGKCGFEHKEATKIETTATHKGGIDQPDQMKAALHQHGPMTVAIQADIMNYSKGIFDD